MTILGADPCTERAAGIRNLTTQLRTQLGTGLMEGVRAVTGEGNAGASGGSAWPPGGTPPPPGQPVAIAVLLSDGRVSDGVPPLEAAQEARRRGVRVYTVGVGTFADPRTFRSGYYGVLDEPTLRAVATETGGEYFRASETGQLRPGAQDRVGATADRGVVGGEGGGAGAAGSLGAAAGVGGADALTVLAHR